MKREKFEKRSEELRFSAKCQSMPAAKAVSTVLSASDRLTLKDAASALGVSYWTARRILIAENVGRYSTAGETPVYPATMWKKFRRVRMTYLVTEADIDRVKRKMRGEKC